MQPSASFTVPMLERIEDDAAFAALASEWDDLLVDTAAPTVFATWAWLSAWRETLGSGHRLAVVTARDPRDGLLLGAAPFAIEARHSSRRPPYRALAFLGSGPAAPDHLDLLVRRGHENVVGTALWRAAARTGVDVFDFDGVRSGSVLERVALRRRGDRERYTEPIPVPYLPLPATWAAYEASLGKNLRQNLGRYARKLDREAGAPVAMRIVGSRREVAPTMADLARLHQEVRTTQGDPGSFRTPDLVAFHTLAAERFHDSGRLRLYRLDVGDRAAAVVYCIRYGNEVAFYSTGYDPEFSRYGPGRAVMAHAISSAIAEGATGFDFLRGDEPYKTQWGAELRHDLRILLPAGARGRLLFAARSLARAVTGRA